MQELVYGWSYREEGCLISFFVHLFSWSNAAVELACLCKQENQPQFLPSRALEFRSSLQASYLLQLCLEKIGLREAKSPSREWLLEGCCWSFCCIQNLRHLFLLVGGSRAAILHRHRQLGSKSHAAARNSEQTKQGPSSDHVFSASHVLNHHMDKQKRLFKFVKLVQVSVNASHLHLKKLKSSRLPEKVKWNFLHLCGALAVQAWWTCFMLHLVMVTELSFQVTIAALQPEIASAFF